MTWKGITQVAVAVALAAGTVVAQRASAGPDVEAMLQGAMHTEQVEGRLGKAIDEYRAVVVRAQAMTPPRKDVAAKALLQVARNQERLGQPAARATYQEIVRNFADQPAEVAAARARVGATVARATQTDVTPRRIIEGTHAQMFDVSADGRFTVGPERVGFSAYNLVLREVATGRSTILVPGSAEGSGFQARLSDDGSRVAYNWSDGQQAYSLRIKGTAPGSPTTVIPSAANEPIGPLDWLPDGRSHLATIARYDGPQLVSRDIVLVDTETRSVQPVKALEGWRDLSPDARVSPDGKYFAYTARPTASSMDRYVYVVDFATRTETALVTSAGSRYNPMWTSDGKRLLFTERTAGRQSLWAIAVESGQAAGAAWMVHADFNDNPIGFTKADVFYFSRSSGGGNYEYVLPRNPSPTDKPVRFLGLSGMFSPDGRSLAAMRSDDLIVRNLDTGEERSFQRAGIGVASPRWLPDGSGVIVVANEPIDGRPTQAFYAVDIKTGSFRRLVARDAPGQVRASVGALSADGRTLFVGARTAAGAPVTAIVGIDLVTGEGRQIFSIPNGLPQGAPGIALSPNGQTLAVYGWIRPSEEARIFTVGIDGSNYREVVPSVRTGSPADTLRWTPDGRSLVFVAHDANRNWRVMRVAAEGGPVEFDGLSFETLSPLLEDLKLFPGNFNNIDLHPDGVRIVASTLTMSRSELWTLDNLIWKLNSR